MKQITVALFILPDTNVLDLGSIAQVFNEAEQMGLKINTVICGETAEISTRLGISINHVTSYKELNLLPTDFLFIMSSDHRYMFTKHFNPSKELLHWLKTTHENGTKICSVCTGAFLLGKAGLLDNIKCTTHWKRTRHLQQSFPEANVQENILFIEDNNIVTSAGSASGIDLALHIISTIKDDYLGHKIARELVVFNRRDGLHPQESFFLQYRNHYHVGIHKVQDYIHRNIGKRLHLCELADVANMSERNFCRIFKKETSLTVFDYITKLRQENISELLKNPDLSKKQIANKVGLESERQVNRLIKMAMVA